MSRPGRGATLEAGWRARGLVGGHGVGQIRVVVADDDPAVRSAIEDVFDDDPRFTVAGTCASGAQAVDLVAATRPDVVLVDVRMPGGGAVLAEVLLARRPGPVVVAV